MKKLYSYKDFLIETILSKDKKEEVINIFVDNACEYLNVEKPKLELSYDENEASEIGSFGYIDPENGNIKIIVINRNLADILRTLAHELVHYKQYKDGKVDYDESEANTLSAIIVRKFGLENKYIYE